MSENLPNSVQFSVINDINLFIYLSLLRAISLFNSNWILCTCSVCCIFQDDAGVELYSFLPARRCASADTSYGSVSVCLPLSVRVCHKSVLYRNCWTNRAGFWHGTSFHLSQTVLKGNAGISKNRGTSLWKFVLNSGLGKFRHGISIIETHYQLSSTGARRILITARIPVWLFTSGLAKSRDPIYKISYDLSYDYRTFIVRPTYDSDSKRAEISLRYIVS